MINRRGSKEIFSDNDMEMEKPAGGCIRLAGRLLYVSKYVEQMQIALKELSEELGEDLREIPRI
jgi:hypothetical protein